MSGIKFHDVVLRFDTTEDFCDWVERFEDLAALHKVKELEKVLPGLLGPKAYAVYRGLDNDCKVDYFRLKNALLSAFSLDSRLAYEQFTSRKLQNGESVDVYVADLKKWGYIVDPELSERFLKHAFLAGLPQTLKAHVRTVLSWERVTLKEIVTETRLKLQEEQVAYNRGQVDFSVFPSNAVKVNRNREVKCFRCQKVGHTVKNCRVEWSNLNNKSNELKEERRCYRCGKLGHIATFCREELPKNE